MSTGVEEDGKKGIRDIHSWMQRHRGSAGPSSHTETNYERSIATLLVLRTLCKMITGE